MGRKAFRERAFAGGESAVDGDCEGLRHMSKRLEFFKEHKEASKEHR